MKEAVNKSGLDGDEQSDPASEEQSDCSLAYNLCLATIMALSVFASVCFDLDGNGEAWFQREKTGG